MGVNILKVIITAMIMISIITLPKLRDNNNINRNFKLTMQLFKDMFQHDSGHYQFNAFTFSVVLNTFTV